MNFSEAEMFLDAMKEMHIRLLSMEETNSEKVNNTQSFLDGVINLLDDIARTEDRNMRMKLLVSFMGTKAEDLFC